MRTGCRGNINKPLKIIPFQQRDVPAYHLTEPRVMLWCYGFAKCIKYFYADVIALLQKPKYRCVVLNGVGGNNGQFFHCPMPITLLNNSVCFAVRFWAL